MAETEIIAPVDTPMFDEFGTMALAWKTYFTRTHTKLQENIAILTDHETRITALEP